MNYIPKWNDEAYFNKYVENLNIKNEINFKSKILTRYKQNVFGKDYIMKRKSIKNYNSALLELKNKKALTKPIVKPFFFFII